MNNMNTIKIISKGELGIILSQLETFNSPKVRIEQYITDSQTASSALWNAYQLGEVKNKIIADFGAGTGIIGIGALLLGAKEVVFIESDNSSIEILKKNLLTIQKITKESKYELGKAIIQEKEVKNVNINADTVIMNPPFGTKQEHADKEFLKVAFKSANVVYSFHKTTTTQFVRSYSNDSGFTPTNQWEYDILLPKTQHFHTKKLARVKTTFWRLERREKNSKP